MNRTAQSTYRGSSYRRCSVVTALMLIVCGLPAISVSGEDSGETARPSAEDIRCQGNQDTLNECAERKLRAAEARMKAAVDALLTMVHGTDSEPLLKESQELWLKFREADCRYAISGLTPDGSMAGQVRNDCRARRTEQRAQQLREMGKCVAAGCPGQ